MSTICHIFVYMKTGSAAIQAIRQFNRFYTDLIGLLNRGLLDSDYSLSEVRILYEIYTSKEIQASLIMSKLHIDKSYLSRILKNLEKDELIRKIASEQDSRAILISLTEKGTTVFKSLNKASNLQIGRLIKDLDANEQDDLVEHMNAIQRILAKKTDQHE